MYREGLNHRMDFLIHLPQNKIQDFLNSAFGRLPYYIQTLLQDYLCAANEQAFDLEVEDMLLSPNAAENLLWFSEATFIQGLSELPKDCSATYFENETDANQFYVQCLTQVADSYEKRGLPDLVDCAFELESPQAFEGFSVQALIRLLNHPSWRSIIYDGNHSDELINSFNAAVEAEFERSQKERQEEVILALARLADQSHLDLDVSEYASETDDPYAQKKLENDMKFIEKLIQSRSSLNEQELLKIDSEIVTAIWDELMKAREFRKLETELLSAKKAIRGTSQPMDDFLCLYERERKLLLCGAAIKGMSLAARLQFMAEFDSWSFISRLSEYTAFHVKEWQ